MTRPTEHFAERPLELIVAFARHYVHGPENQYDHLFYFSKNRVECMSLTIFGGRVYRQKGGWCWFCGSRKQLTALCKLLEGYEEPVNNQGLVLLMERSKRWTD